jgi:hypothetical protein
MGKRDRVMILRADMAQHPATQAWQQLQNSAVLPERIEILKRRPKDQRKSLKKLVCRLVGTGPGGVSVIAKRCKRSSADVESVIYREVLPQLPIPSLTYYGMVREENSEFCWLFLEDAGNGLMPDQLAEHRTLIAQWLGDMHASSAQIPDTFGLPTKSVNHYLERLKSSREVILGHIANHNLSEADVATLEAVVSHCDILETHWAQIEAMCRMIPDSLVHGDFAGKNFAVRLNGFRSAVLPFDWAEGGWGTPAVDVRKADVRAYLSAARNWWSWLDAETVQGLALAGRMFRCIDSIYWERSSLKYLWWDVPMHNMRVYENRLAGAIKEAGLGA